MLVYLITLSLGIIHFFIKLQIYTKEETGTGKSITEMSCPKECWKHIYNITNHLASIKLPPATSDFKEAAGKASITHKVQWGQFHKAKTPKFVHQNAKIFMAFS